MPKMLEDTVEVEAFFLPYVRGRGIAGGGDSRESSGVFLPSSSLSLSLGQQHLFTKNILVAMRSGKISDVGSRCC